MNRWTGHVRRDAGRWYCPIISIRPKGIYMSYRFKLGKTLTCDVATKSGVFVPTHTSVLCVEAVRNQDPTPGRVLDLGCGCGVVGIALAKLGYAREPLFASDISPDAVSLTLENCATHKTICDGRVGSIFEPWSNMEFDTIVNDVSGIAEEAAKLSPWFGEVVPCASGDDGTALTRAVLKAAPNYLAKNGALYIPVISLSRVERILEAAHFFFRTVEKASSQDWLLPKEMIPHLDQLEELKGNGLINFSRKFGMVMCRTEFFVCSEPKGK